MVNTEILYFVAIDFVGVCGLIEELSSHTAAGGRRIRTIGPACIRRSMFNPDARATWLLTEVDPD